MNKWKVESEHGDIVAQINDDGELELLVEKDGDGIPAGIEWAEWDEMKRYIDSLWATYKRQSTREAKS